MPKTSKKAIVVAQTTSKRSEMAPVDRKINDVIFDTKVNIAPFYSKDKDKFYCMVTIGQAQDKQFLITVRKDGRGVCVLTDYQDYQYAKKPTMSASV